jgi:ABC-type sulfate/molybdate transport systems ATPase subunit
MRQWHPQRDGLAIGLAVSGSAAEILGLTDWLDRRLTQVSGGSPTFYVTHDQVQAMTMGDRVTVMRDRRAAATDQASPRRARSGTSATLALVRSFRPYTSSACARS